MHEHEHLQRLLNTIREINKAMHRIMREEAEKMDTTAIQILVLRVLAKKPHIALGELAEQLRSGNSTMSGIVDRLVKAGLVIREYSQTDRRSLTMRLTAKGAEKEKEAYARVMNRLAVQLQEMSSADLQQLLQLHGKLLEKLR